MTIEEFELNAWDQEQEKIRKYITKYNERLNNVKTIAGVIHQNAKTVLGLSDEEISALLASKFDDPHAANYILKYNCGAHTTIANEIPKALESAISKLPKPNGVEKTYRFYQDYRQHYEHVLSNPDAYLDKCFKVGRFLSTSANRKFAGGDAYRVVSEIRLNDTDSKGADLHQALTTIVPPGVGLAENEFGVLFPLDTIFKIIGVNKDACEKLFLKRTMCYAKQN